MAEPCKHESVGRIRGMVPEIFEGKKRVWKQHLHLCRLCKCLYVETVPEGDGHEIGLALEGQDAEGNWYATSNKPDPE